MTASRLNIITQALVAIAVVAGDVLLHLLHAPIDGFDAAIPIIVTAYFGVAGLHAMSILRGQQSSGPPNG